ncbi:DUF2800 domain-containing protein [Xylella fastidiosa subsp. multiplex]|uniref:DUF2800 domain-containing protein n=1 Tax=Xylella fastidiosa TaxID=2371 RepID=UPI00234E30C6|nr:DUF2800 domain-containing protein [Xylella fastidiosa]MDC6416642.1 DUF2800 domain-containing protein [Xylella fastidiosa subsp. multiplex]
MRFCKAKASCPALATHVLNTVADDFVDLTKPIVPQLSYAACARLTTPRWPACLAQQS